MRRTLLGLAFAALMAAPIAAAQVFDPPRTSDGHPDFQGVWDAPWVTPLERPANVTSLVVSASEAEAIADGRRDLPFRNALNVASPIDYTDKLRLTQVNGEYRTSEIIDPPDGRVPYTDAGRAILAQVFSYEGPEAMQLQSRCIAAGGPPPMFVMPAESVRQIVQTPQDIVIYSESLNDLRIIPIGARHRPNAMLSVFGDSIGRWEGDTLVVETTQFRPDMQFRSLAGTRLILGPGTKVTERLSFAAGGQIAYRFTVEDAAFYAMAWTGEYTMVRIPGRAYETACHEGNYAMTNLLRGARVEEQRKARGN